MQASGVSEIANDWCHAELIELCRRSAGPRQSEQLVAAPDQLACNGGADQAGPTENENTQGRPFLWKPAHGSLAPICSRGSLASGEYCGAAA
jgi:hypothetical protein